MDTLRARPQLAVFPAIGIGFLVRSWKMLGFNPGNVTATLLAGAPIGQFGTLMSSGLKDKGFPLFLCAVGHGVGRQFARQLAADGPKQVAVARSFLVPCLPVHRLCFAISVPHPPGHVQRILDIPRRWWKPRMHHHCKARDLGRGLEMPQLEQVRSSGEAAEFHARVQAKFL